MRREHVKMKLLQLSCYRTCVRANLGLGTLACGPLFMLGTFRGLQLLVGQERTASVRENTDGQIGAVTPFMDTSAHMQRRCCSYDGGPGDVEARGLHPAQIDQVTRGSISIWNYLSKRVKEVRQAG